MTDGRTYAQIFNDLGKWSKLIVFDVKKDIKQGHLKNNIGFFKTHFPSKNIQKVTPEELAEVYTRLIQEGEESLGEFIASRWLLQNTELYHFFENKLAPLYEDITKIDEIEEAHADKILKEALKDFGPKRTYLFCHLSDVRFPKKHYSDLLSQVEATIAKEDKQKQDEETRKSEERSIKQLEQELSRTHDKYEKKLQGMQQKYIQDTERLKKQVAQLQRKLAEKQELPTG